VLEQTRYLTDLLQALVGDSDLQIVIGSENTTSQLRSCAVILTTYGPSKRIKGVLGVVGPTRMNYGQVVGRLQTVARAANARIAGIQRLLGLGKSLADLTGATHGKAPSSGSSTSYSFKYNVIVMPPPGKHTPPVIVPPRR